MKIAVVGIGYVGLITSVTLAHIGYNITCIDVDENKIENLNKGISPIYEEQLDELLSLNKKRLKFTTDYKKSYSDVEIIFIAVGTPINKFGSADLKQIHKTIFDIAQNVKKDCTVIIKSTVPVGTCDEIEDMINKKMRDKIKISIVFNPEFLSQGSAINDSLHASRIIIGVEDKAIEKILRKLYNPLIKKPYNIPYISMDRKSAEMIKYSSNCFLALKLSYINEIANFCELAGANIDLVTKGMGFDSRIGDKFLNAGIGYGGSCFPKDTKILLNLASKLNCDVKTIESAIEVNEKQKTILIDKLLKDYKTIKDKNIAVLGATFKPKTDDIREASSIYNIEYLIKYGANVTVYDPVGLNKLKKIFKNKISYSENINESIKDKEIVLIMTEWDEIKNFPLRNYSLLMKTAVIYDGRNCYSLDEIKKYDIKYVSIGRQVMDKLKSIQC